MNTSIKQKAVALSENHYTTRVFNESTDGIHMFVAVHPNLSGCMAQGNTPEEAIAILGEVRLEYFQHLLETDQPIPKVDKNPYLVIQGADLSNSGLSFTTSQLMYPATDKNPVKTPLDNQAVEDPKFVRV